MRSFSFLLFVVITFLCWGLYGPVLHVGQEALGGGGGQKSLLRPLICVGVAYFLIAVVFPVIVLRTRGEQGHWSAGGFVWSFVAGAVGAIGALGIVLAFKFQGKPFYVMPLVFGLAPIVNTLVTMLMARTFKQASPIFYAGILIVAIGAAGVLYNKPSAAKPIHVEPAVTNAVQKADAVAASGVSNVSQSPAEETTTPADAGISEGDDIQNADGEAAGDIVTDRDAARVITEAVQPEKVDASALLDPASTKKTKVNSLLVGLSIALTALCWGAYGPMLHKGQSKMGGSRLRPFFCVGLAYFVIAVVVPGLLLGQIADPGSFSSVPGILWSLAAGATGAVGALGIIYAFNFGGKPIFVMPLVFGLAPVINTFYEIVTRNLYGQVPQMFYVSLALVILGATIVLVMAPRKKPVVAT